MDREAQVALLLGTRERQVATELARPGFEKEVEGRGRASIDKQVRGQLLSYPVRGRPCCVVPVRGLLVALRHRCVLVTERRWRLAWHIVEPVEPPDVGGLGDALRTLAERYETRGEKVVRCAVCRDWTDDEDGAGAAWCAACAATPTNRLDERRALVGVHFEKRPPETAHNFASDRDVAEFVVTREVFERWIETAEYRG